MNWFKLNQMYLPLLDADNDGGGGKKEEEPPKDLTEGLNPDQIKALVTDLVTKKQEANAEAKENRLKLEKFEKEQAEKAKAEADKDKSLETKLTEKENEINTLKSQMANNEAKHKARSQLLGEGYNPKMVELAVDGINVENVDERIKTFQKDFKDTLKKEEDKPNLPFDPNAHHRATPPKGPDGQTSTAARAFDEIRGKKG